MLAGPIAAHVAWLDRLLDFGPSTPHLYAFSSPPRNLLAGKQGILGHALLGRRSYAQLCPHWPSAFFLEGKVYLRVLPPCPRGVIYD
jgi:hypothetical protein